jgi:hypothetical protein
MPRRLKTEQESHRRWFEHYAASVNRSHEKTAQAMGVSVAAVKLAATSFGWKQRVRDRDLEQARQVADRALQTTHDDQDRYRKVVRMAVMKLARAIAEDRVKLQSADLDRLIRLDAFLNGPPTAAGITTTSSPEEILDFFERLTTAEQDQIITGLERRLAANAGDPTGPSAEAPPP